MTTTPVLDADREQTPTGADQASGVALRTWAHLVGVLAARMYRAFLLGLVVIALAPFLFGWGSYVIKSGSMEPSIQVGDVVIGKPFTEDQRIRVGRVFVYDDPATARPHLMIHRIVELRDDGDYTTAGDANEVTDFTPLPRSDVRATAILLVPYVGLPVAWSQSGEWVHLALWLLLTMAAFALAVRNLEGEPPRYGLLRLVRAWFTRRTPPSDPPGSGSPDGSSTTDEQRPTTARTPGRALRSRVPLMTVAGLVLLSTLASTASAGFTGQTRTSGMSWTVGPWVQPYVSAVLADSPSSFWLLDETGATITAQDRSGHNVLGTYKATTTRGGAGGLPNNPGTSMSTTGALALTSANQVPSSTTHTTELWFKTADSSGGYLTGFGSSNSSNLPPTEDRVVWMNPSGKITYGDWSSSLRSVIATPLSYNNDAWHHLVVVSTASSFGRQNTTIYVDGAARVSGQTSRVANYNGYVRVGGGTGSDAYNGSIDNVSVYGIALSAQRVAAHYAAR